MIYMIGVYSQRTDVRKKIKVHTVFFVPYS